MANLHDEPIGGLIKFTPERFEGPTSIGSGNNATVFRAWDQHLQREVAFKISMHELLLDELGTERLDELGITEGVRRYVADAGAADQRRYTLLREARLLAMVDHPNVITVLDVGILDDDAVAVVLPYLEGGSLDEQEFDEPWEEVLDIAMQIGRGLAAIHAAGILHRDFKPNNVLFDADRWARIADLGLACRLDDAEAMAEWVGTSEYMSPEALDQRFRDVRDDIYAFCMVVYRMFYNHPPFASSTARAQGRVLRLPREGGMPRELHEIIERGLAPDADARWQNMTDLVRSMKRVRQTVRQDAPRRRWPWAMATVGLAASMAIGVIASARMAHADECEDASRELAAIWNDRVATELRAVFGTRKAGDGLQAWASRWATVRAQECDVARSEELDTAVTPCTVSVRDRFQATVQAFRTPHLRPGSSYATVIADLPAPEHCLEHPEDTDWGYGGLLELRNIDIEVEALAKLGDLEAASTRQVVYMDLARELQSEYGIGRAIYFRGEIHRLSGSLDDATADFERAYEMAWALRVAEFVGEVQMKLTAVAGARQDLAAMDAYALGARNVFAATWPERVAEVLQVQGLALVAGPEDSRERGLEVLHRAVEMREEQLRVYGGTRELLSQAHESYGRGLLAMRRPEDAIGYLDLALSVHQDEFGHGSWRTRGILKAKFEALVELGRIDESMAQAEAILHIHRKTENWPRYAEDAFWLADAFLRGGYSGLALTPLRWGRDVAITYGLADDARTFDLAIEELHQQ